MNRTVLAALVLALGLVAAATAFGLFFYNARDSRDTVQVVGAATQQFEADVAKWRLGLTRSVPLGGVREGYSRLDADVQQLLTQLRTSGITDDAITLQPPTSSGRYDQNGRITGYEVSQNLYVVVPDVDAIEAFALRPGELSTGGASLQYSQIEYYYDDLATLKRSLLAQATEDARQRAGEIAGSGGGMIDQMVAARAGVFQITEPYSTEVSSYGIHSTATRQQEITVTVHATFTVQ